MTATATTMPPPPDRGTGKLPRRRDDLIIRPAGEEGKYVVKSTIDRTYFQIGAPEHFLLQGLDGSHTASSLRVAYEQHFAEPLTEADLIDFLRMASAMTLLATDESASGTNGQPGTASPSKPKPKQSIFYFRRTLFDPDRLFNWLEPQIRFVWSGAFLAFSVFWMAIAGMVAWSNRHTLINQLENAFSWQMVVLFWVTLVVTMFLHEFAHGLTCKHFGGEVREVGVLVMFFSPCFYCNVSDAWLFSEKWKRIWVGIAGPFLDLCLWAAATLIWRITMQDSIVNYVAWTVMAACGARTVMNFNPLMKSDGYYLLSDWTQLPNLQQLSMDRWMATARWLLWGAPRPSTIPKGKFLLGFGFANWLFILIFLGAMIPTLLTLPGSIFGVFGFVLSIIIVSLMMLVAFNGIFNQEVRTMIQVRSFRTKVWIAALASAAVALFVVPFGDRASGVFQIRPRIHVEIRAPEAGFLREIISEQGRQVKPGEVIAKIHVPDLEMLMRKKQAELKESEARLKILEAGPRKEEVAEQRLRLIRAERWRDSAKQNLLQAKEALAQDMIRLDRQIEQHDAELQFAKRIVGQAESLFQQRAFAGEQLRAEQKKLQIAQLQVEQAKAQKLAREATGAVDSESELARREKELAEVSAALSLMEIGTRPEEIDAERAKRERLQEDLAYFHSMQGRLVITSPVAGTVVTSHMRDKNGKYLEKGEAICVVEDTTQLEAEIALPEEDAASIVPGQTIQLKARALPFKTFHSTVERKAPSAVLLEGKLQGTVTVFCRVSETDSALVPGMTGIARVSRGWRPIGWVFGAPLLKMLRTEFWW